MPLPWMDREEELKRLDRALGARDPALVVIYGRRRCGKSRLVLEALGERLGVYFVGDEREGTLQRQSLAAAMDRVIPGFASVDYPSWESLLVRWGNEAPRRAVLALDEFPYLAASGPELSSLLQKLIDDPKRWRSHLILCGSSQRMMHGLVLDASAPLYGRAREILKIEPLLPGWLHTAFPRHRTRELIEAHAVWGGVPRYWELAVEFDSVREAVRELVLDPLGVLFEEPTRLLLDEMQEIVQASSVLSLIGAGCHRLSEIAGRLQKPSTALSGPLRRLVDMGLVRRDVPFGTGERDNKRSRYVIGDPFLAFWFRFVPPNRSLLAARQIDLVAAEIEKELPTFLGHVWEELARRSVSAFEVAGRRWRPAAPWWGTGVDKRALEIDIVAESVDRKALLIGEAKLRVGARDWPGLTKDVLDKVSRFPFAEGREIIPSVWFAEGAKPPTGWVAVDGAQVFEGLR